MKLIDGIVANAAAIGQLRRDLHAHPELSFEELRTAALVARKLSEWGIPMHQGMAQTGVIGIVHGRDGGAGPGKRSRAIGLRADMDALPMQEHNRFCHASVFDGKMHACGHDGHVAMLLAAAPSSWSTKACSSVSRWTRCSACTTGPATRWARWQSAPGR